MTQSTPAAQSAPDRKAAEAELTAIIARHAPAHAKLLSAVRRKMRTLLPAAREIVYEYKTWLVISYSPSDKGYEGVFALRACADGVSFHFNQGKTLPDPEKLLKGTGKQTRLIDLESATTLARPAVAKLIQLAIARNPIPFAKTTRGPVVIHQTAGKKKPEGSTASAKARK